MIDDVPIGGNSGVPIGVNTVVPIGVNTVVPIGVNSGVPTSINTVVPTSINTVVPTSITTSIPIYMKRTCFCLICLLLPLCLMQAQISWPNAKKAAIVLTYDDGLESQRRIAIPQLEAKNLRGTFFLYGQVVKETDVPQWRAAAQRGHELGNHSLFHPCLAGTTAESTSSPCHSLECYSVKDMLIEISLMNSFLYAIDGKQEHAYAYPCGQSVAGGEDYSQPLLRSGLTRYARGGGAQGMTTDATTLDLSKVPTFAVPEGCKAQQLIGFVKEVADKGG